MGAMGSPWVEAVAERHYIWRLRVTSDRCFGYMTVHL